MLKKGHKLAENGNESKITEEVDTFIRRLYDLEYVIDPRADDLRYVDRENRNLGSLSDALSQTLIAYQENRTNPKDKIHSAIAMQAVIAKLYANGVVKPGEGLRRKLSECSNKNIELENDLKKLSIEYLQLQERYNELEKELHNKEGWK